jgi:putative ABC transport system permease protein
MKARKMRTILTVLGIIIGVAALVGLVTLSKGMNEAVQYQFEKMGISSIRVVPGGLNGPPTGSLGLPAEMQDKIETVKGVEYANPVTIDYATVEYNKEKEICMVESYDTALSGQAFLDMDLKTTEGRYFNSGESGVTVIGYDIAHDVFDKDIGVRNTITINNKDFKVIGIIEESGTDADNRVNIPLEDAKVLFNKGNFVNVFIVQTTSGISAEEVGAKIEEKLLKSMEDEEFDVFTPEQLLKQISAMLGVIQLVLGAIAAISLVVGAIGIMNSMFTAVLERTQEIGVMKAIGATEGTILYFFITEAGIMGVVGGIIGTILGTLFSYAVQLGASLAGYALFKVQLDFAFIISVILFSLIIGIIAGTIPAHRAAQMKPVDALRYE